MAFPVGSGTKCAASKSLCLQQACPLGPCVELQELIWHSGPWAGPAFQPSVLPQTLVQGLAALPHPSSTPHPQQVLQVQGAASLGP